MLSVQQFEYLGDYKIRLTFNNGKSGIANLKETICHDKRPIFSSLKDLNNFKKVVISHGTLTWFNELDLAPEYLFYITFSDEHEFEEMFVRWGYKTRAEL